MSSQKPRVDEEEDLDDLDDVLDQFSQPTSQQQHPTSPPPPLPAASSSKSSLQPSTSTDAEFGADLSAEFAREMESLLKELQASPPDHKGDKDEGDQQRAFAAAWEAMLVEGMNGMMDPASKSDGTPSAPSPKAKESDTFQSRIRSTVNKLKESESGLNAFDFGSEDSLEALLSKLGGGADAPESEEELQGVLEAMMGQLMSKEVLYEPLKELSEKFPGYLVENSSSISPEDKKRFDAQIVCIRKLLDAFEASDYHEDNDKSRQRIAELMGELQSRGSPPEEVMGPLPPGFSMGADGLPAGECTVS